MARAYETVTRCRKINARAPDMRLIDEAAALIRAGKLVAFPTETVYGLGANALDDAAVGRIFAAKGRPSSDPLIVHLASVDDVSGVAVDIPQLGFDLLRRFAPGALTLVLRKSESIPPNLSAGRDTVALRIPDHPVALALIREAGVPIAAPSANRFSRPSPTSASHVLADLDGRVDLLLDAGSAAIGLESTIVDLSQSQATVLRAGGITLEALRQVAPDVVYEPPYLSARVESAPAPGSMLKHYSPRAVLKLFSGERDNVLSAMRDEIKKGEAFGVLALEADLAHFEDMNAPHFSLGENMEDAAARLFAGLRQLDACGVDCILARAPEDAGLGLALGDRLLRAAAGELSEV